MGTAVGHPVLLLLVVSLAPVHSVTIYPSRDDPFKNPAAQRNWVTPPRSLYNSTAFAIREWDPDGMVKGACRQSQVPWHATLLAVRRCLGVDLCGCSACPFNS